MFSNLRLRPIIELLAITVCCLFCLSKIQLFKQTTKFLHLLYYGNPIFWGVTVVVHDVFNISS